MGEVARLNPMTFPSATFRYMPRNRCTGSDSGEIRRRIAIEHVFYIAIGRTRDGRAIALVGLRKVCACLRVKKTVDISGYLPGSVISLFLQNRLGLCQEVTARIIDKLDCFWKNHVFLFDQLCTDSSLTNKTLEWLCHGDNSC